MSSFPRELPGTKDSESSGFVLQLLQILNNWSTELIRVLVVIWLPLSYHSTLPGRAVALWRWLWAVCSICIPAGRIICGFQERGVKGHTLFLFPLLPLWNRLPFHFCFIGLLKGCQLDVVLPRKPRTCLSLQFRS
ncbi:protein yippee-like 2 isoform X1 [Manacus candei]|uniref:protein yippee-like 2 isoform X1 n=1 Tax=Manacus candei TaxID=415023 RepID=UPI0022260DDB|nr:protein yippee-like 2 isoform X1 [Manacus candei]